MWCRHGRELLARGPLAARSFAGRYHSELACRKVVSFTGDALWQTVRSRRARSISQTYSEFIRIGEWFCRRTNARLEAEHYVPGLDAFFGFNTASLETIEYFRDRDVLTVVDQIDPGPVEERIVQNEARKWPGWQDAPGKIPEAYFERITHEWTLADLIVVNSAWSRSALRECGVDPAKTVVVPVGYEPSGDVQPLQKRAAFPKLRVLWIGSVNLRKGIQYLIAAAKLLKSAQIEFIVAGPVQISAEAVASAPDSVRFLGRVSRAQTKDLYRKADVFVIPTVSDGFAITQLEAMGFGLPVITTPNCGEVVTNGTDGLIVPACDAEALANAILRVDRDRELLASMAAAAPGKAAQFGLREQSEHLECAIRDWTHNVNV
jgi:glycosyltransferase involved in cell wall biosynthesis